MFDKYSQLRSVDKQILGTCQVSNMAFKFLTSTKDNKGRELIVEVRPSDGYFNATKMCASSKRKWAEYARNRQTLEFLAALSKSEGLADASELVQSQHGGFHPGTWVHPAVAKHLQHWCLQIKRKRSDSGYIYAATSPIINAVKIGMWSGSIDNLRARYITPYGPDLATGSAESSSGR